MPITAKIIKDSIGPAGVRLTTLELRYPRMIHPEFMTHRVMSRNASSSRAIPSKRIRASVAQEPAKPIYWGQNRPGMQADAELAGWRRGLAENLFMGSRFPMLGVVWALEKIGLHKQLANRLLEPWSHITVVVTATEWENFFALRCHPAAQPEMRELACAIRRAMNSSEPEYLQPGEWHLPYVTDLEKMGPTFGLDHKDLIKYSVARCARVSYLTHDGQNPDPIKDIALHDRLISQGHMSPTEHQAAVPVDENYQSQSNLRGWVQYRKTLFGERVFKGGMK